MNHKGGFTQVKRLPEKAVNERRVLDEILDSGLVAHVGVSDREQPIVIPVAYARLADQVVIHGSSASRLFKLLATGCSAALTVTILDGIVLARSLFESSMHYRCAMLFGSFRTLTGAEELAGLKAITDQLVPGRWEDARQPTTQELKATSTLAMHIDQWSVKVSNGDPTDTDEDLANPGTMQIWAGVLPIENQIIGVIADPLVPPGVAVPDYVRARQGHRL